MRIATAEPSDGEEDPATASEALRDPSPNSCAAPCGLELLGRLSNVACRLGFRNPSAEPIVRIPNALPEDNPDACCIIFKSVDASAEYFPSPGTAVVLAGELPTAVPVEEDPELELLTPPHLLAKLATLDPADAALLERPFVTVFESGGRVGLVHLLPMLLLPLLSMLSEERGSLLKLLTKASAGGGRDDDDEEDASPSSSCGLGAKMSELEEGSSICGRLGEGLLLDEFECSPAAEPIPAKFAISGLRFPVEEVMEKGLGGTKPLPPEGGPPGPIEVGENPSRLVAPLPGGKLGLTLRATWTPKRLPRVPDFLPGVWMGLALLLIPADDDAAEGEATVLPPGAGGRLPSGEGSGEATDGADDERREELEMDPSGNMAPIPAPFMPYA